MTTYTEEDLNVFVVKAANYVAYRYRLYNVEAEDVAQEIRLWQWQHRDKVARWLDASPQQTTRIYRSFLDAGLVYAETEKAEVAGYRPMDVWWYTPNQIEDLIPLALDLSFRQENEHVGDQITMVIDVRRALEAAHLFEWFAEHDDDHEDYRVNLQLVLDQLGGERPAVGRRKVMSNAQAQAITE